MSLHGYLLTFLLILLANAIYGQQSADVSKSLSFKAGAAHHRFIDEAFSHERVKYKGTNFTGVLSYERASHQSYLRIEAGGITGSASAPAPRPDANMIHIWLGVTYARQVLSHSIGQASGSLYFGGQLSSSNYVIENVDEHDEVSVATYHTANLFIFDRMEISSRNRLQLSLSVPLLGFVKRGNYDGGINLDFEQQYQKGAVHVLVDDAAFRIVNPVSLIRFNVDFLRRLRPEIDFVLRYEYSYLRNTDIAPLNLYGNALVTGFRFNLNNDK